MGSGGVGFGGSGWGSQGGCERRIEVFWENSEEKNFWGGVGGGGGGGGREGGSGGGVGLVVGVRVDVNTMLGVGGDVGYGACEPRIEGIVQ